MYPKNYRRLFRRPNITNSCRNAVPRSFMPTELKPAQYFRCVACVIDLTDQNCSGPWSSERDPDWVAWDLRQRRVPGLQIYTLNIEPLNTESSGHSVNVCWVPSEVIFPHRLIGNDRCCTVQLLWSGGSSRLPRQCVVQPHSSRWRAVRAVVMLSGHDSTTKILVILSRRTSCLPAGRHPTLWSWQQTTRHCAQDSGMQL